MEKLAELYKRWKGEAPVSMTKLPEAGSSRKYYRITGNDGESVIGVVGTSRDENHAFIYLDRHFMLRQLPVPHVLAVSEDELR